MHLSPLRICATLALCVAAVGCSSTSPSAKGSLTVTITPNDGTTPSVVITGPNGYSNTIAATQTITGLALGSYTIVADSAIAADSVVGTVTDTGTVSGSPANVVSGTAATVTVTYYTEDHVGGLWVANNASPTLPEFSASQLRPPGTTTAAESLSTINAPAGLALDASGNMWESSYDGDSIVSYSPAARNSGGAPTTVITSSAVTDGENIAFDGNGNLWVSDCDGGSIHEFTPSQLAAGGPQTPTVTINGGSIVTCPYSFAFDGSGNVWVADDDNTRFHVVEYSAAQLAVAGTSTPIPVDTIGTNGGSLDCTDAVAFDPSGDLWVANDCQPTVVEYTAGQLATGGAPAPTAVVTLANNADPFGLAFDKRGTLWVSDDNNDIILGLASSQLVTGSPTPSVTLSVVLGGGLSPEQPLLDPYATGVAISAARLRPHTAPLARTLHLTKKRRHGRRV
jgi:streptogramin lyase